MAKAHPPGSFGSGEDGGQANASEMLDDPETNEYGDEGFDSEDPSPIRRTSGDELRRDARKGAEDSSKNAALRDYDNSSDPEMELEISASSSDAGDVELGSAQPTQPVNGKGSEAQEMDNSSLVPQLDDGKGEAAVNDGSNQEDRKDDSALAPRKTRPPEADERGSVTDFQEPRKPPDDLDEGYLSPRVPGGDDDDRNHDQSVGSLDMYNQSSFQVDDDRNSPQGLSPYRPDGAGRGSLSDDDGSGLFSPQPFASPEEGLDVDGGMHNKQLLALQYNGDRCSTRGKQPGGIVRGRTEFGHVTPRARSQLSADEDDFSATTSFSAAMKLQRAAPPPFPRDGGTPAPSPRVTRGWTHKNPPSPTRTSPVERNLSYTTLVRQLDAGGRRARTLKRVNEELGARVNELESGGVLRAAQSRLAERDEEIVVLREELSVMNRLARAQDRKFEGSQGYALARRLWLAEEELRLARSTISALGGEAKGELRAAQAEIDELKEDKAVLGKTLDIKAKEIRMQLLQVNRLKRELRDLSAGATKLEEASGVAASASRPMRTRGISSAAAAAGQASATGATKIDVALIERRVKSAAVGSSSNKTPATVGAGRASLRSLVATQRAPPPLSDNHPRAGPRTGYKLLSSPVGGNSLPMEWNRDWGGDGTEISRAPVTTPPDTTPVKGEVRRGSPGSQTDPAMAIYGDGESGGIKAGEAEERQTAANDKPGETEGAPVSARKKLRPCPLAGILDMSEPPLRNHRRSYYNEDDGKVYLLPQHGDTSSVAGVEEPPREEERFKCVVDFKGDVRHGEDCVLREVARTTPPPSERNSLASKGGSGQQPSYQTTLPAAIPVRMWHKERTSEWAPAGVEATERLSLISNRDRSPRTSCVSLSEDGRFTPTIGFVRRPTHFSVEAVPESEKERV
eukprot:g4723.t1